jgi:GDP-4-dehydro-6-deoxy-D-mannose reductase
VATRILVTGANGFAGRHLLGLLAAEEPGAEVHAWRRPGTPIVLPRPPRGAGARPDAEHDAEASPGAVAAATPPINWSIVDVLDRRSVRDAVAAAAPDQVYHLAGAAHVGDSWRDATGALDVNVLGTHRLLDALLAVGLRPRVLVTGSAMIYEPGEGPLTEECPVAATSPYALSKLAQERLGARAWEEDDIPVLLVRAFNHIGPGQDPSFFAPAFARQLAAIERGLAPPVLRVGNLEARRDLTDVRDTVRAYHALMGRGTPGRPYNVCSGRAWRIQDVLDLLLDRCRVRVTLELDPARLRPSDTPVMLGSFSRLRHDTGWQPSIALETTIGDILDSAREDVVSAGAAGRPGGAPAS